MIPPITPLSTIWLLALFHGRYLLGRCRVLIVVRIVFLPRTLPNLLHLPLPSYMRNNNSSRSSQSSLLSFTSSPPPFNLYVPANTSSRFQVYLSLYCNCTSMLFEYRRLNVPGRPRSPFPNAALYLCIPADFVYLYLINSK